MREKFLHFTIDDVHLLLPILLVVQVCAMVEIEILPGSPSVINGLINFKGTIVPVYNLRKRFQLNGRTPLITDQLIVTQAGNQRVALWVDQCLNLVEIEQEEITDIPALAPTKYIRAIYQKENQLFLLAELDQFLEEEETISLESLLRSAKSPVL